MDCSCLVFQGLQPCCSLRGWGGNESCHSISQQGPSHLPDRGTTWRWEGCCTRACIHPAHALLRLFFSLYYLLLRGMGGAGGLGSGETFATFLHSFSAPSTPINLEKTLLKGVRRGGAGRGNTEGIWRGDDSLSSKFYPEVIPA